MRAAFTPGPWNIGPWVDSMGGHVYRVITHEGRKVSAISVYGRRADGSVGGQALKFGGHTKTVSAEECDANARLIAAAPELYEALSELMDTLRREAPGTSLNNHRFDALGLKANKALAKASAETVSA